MLPHLVGVSSVRACWPSHLVQVFAYCNDDRIGWFLRPRTLPDLSLTHRYNKQNQRCSVKITEVLFN